MASDNGEASTEVLVQSDDPFEDSKRFESDVKLIKPPVTNASPFEFGETEVAKDRGETSEPEFEENDEVANVLRQQGSINE